MFVDVYKCTCATSTVTSTNPEVTCEGVFCRFTGKFKGRVNILIVNCGERESLCESYLEYGNGHIFFLPFALSKLVMRLSQ